MRERGRQGHKSPSRRTLPWDGARFGRIRGLPSEFDWLTVGVPRGYTRRC